MSRVIVVVALLLAGVGAALLAVTDRYQYSSVVGPSSNARDYAEVDARRVDRWTGAVEVWVCRDVDTPEPANVPVAPKASDYGNADTPDGVTTSGRYFIALALWRKTFPHVDPDTLHATKPVCSWNLVQ